MDFGDELEAQVGHVCQASTHRCERRMNFMLLVSDMVVITRPGGVLVVPCSTGTAVLQGLAAADICTSICSYIHRRQHHRDRAQGLTTATDAIKLSSAGGCRL